mgnify:CR=1 FL=1
MYDASAKHHESYLLGLCNDDGNPRGQSWASAVLIQHIPLRDYEGIRIINGETNYIYSSRLDSFYTVEEEGWYNVVFQFCYWSHLFTSNPSAAPTMYPTGIPTQSPSGANTTNTTNTTGISSNITSTTNTTKPRDSMDFDDYNDDDYNKMILIAESYVVAEGQVSFKNPYGYLPAGLFGVLPYQVHIYMIYTMCTIYAHITPLLQ